MNKDANILIRINTKDKKKLAKLCIKKRMSMSQLVRNYILELLEK